MKVTFAIRNIVIVVFLFSAQLLFSQSPAKWGVNGNVTSGGDFFGTTNNNPIVFYANNTEFMRLKANGELKINNLAGTGNSFVLSNSNGVLYTKPFTSDTNKFMTEAGVFRTASSFTGWKFNGNNIHTINGSFVGIGLNNPQYQLDVNGDAHFNGTLFSQGLMLATKMQADTVKSTSMISVNNNLSFYSGLVNDIYTSTGDVRLQSRTGYGGNTILNAGNNGNVGIGVYSPQYKVDVNGDVRVSGKMYIQRILSLPGDSEIHFGDSSIVLLPTVNRIYGSNTANFKGLGLGSLTFAHGLFSTALGYSVETGSAATSSIAMGSGISYNNHLINTTPNSLMVGFNSTVATLFVGPGNGAGTVGRVGIGTPNPKSSFQVGDGQSSASMGGTSGSGALFSTSYFGFNVAHSDPTHWTLQGSPYSNGNGGVAIFGTINGSLEIVNIPISATNPTSDQVIDDAYIAAHNFFEIRPDGKVVISQNPQPIATPGTYRLYVADGIITEKLKVTTIANWSDYVFDSTYTLFSLDTVADFIQKNHHLPGVPSAVDVNKNGIDVADTDALLLAKIEELTLYMIQLQNQNALMQKQI
ncbi:MAG: hypothetical protein ABIQ40_04515, partial [Bacteroidia bacterium]